MKVEEDSDPSSLGGNVCNLVLGPPPDEVLAQTIEKVGGDLELNWPGGRYRLAAGTPTWTRYWSYLNDSGIEPLNGTARGREWDDHEYAIDMDYMIERAIDDARG